MTLTHKYTCTCINCLQQSFIYLYPLPDISPAGCICLTPPLNIFVTLQGKLTEHTCNTVYTDEKSLYS